jgi:hypothetical protein
MPASARTGEPPAAKERVGRDDEDVDEGGESRGKDQPRKDNAGANRSR